MIADTEGQFDSGLKRSQPHKTMIYLVAVLNKHGNVLRMRWIHLDKPKGTQHPPVEKTGLLTALQPSPSRLLAAVKATVHAPDWTGQEASTGGFAAAGLSWK